MQQLADLIGKNESDISNYENGYAKPQADTLLTLQKFFEADFSLMSKEFA